jgi:hypothetical protein
MFPTAMYAIDAAITISTGRDGSSIQPEDSASSL